MCTIVVFASTNHNNSIWNISANTNASGYHYNISEFWVQSNATLYVEAFDGSDKGYLKVNASKMYVYGTIMGDGRGYGGGSGGGGGGGAEGNCHAPSSYQFAGGAGGAGTNQAGHNGNGGGSGWCGDVGGAGGSAGTSYDGNNASAPANDDATTSFDALIGQGGGGGKGGKGGNKGFSASHRGGGGGGGGVGGDGGAALTLISKSNLILTGSLLFRAGQNNCTLAENGNPSYWTGGDGGANDAVNCKATPGGSGGSGTGGSVGAVGVDGGSGAGGMVILAAYNLILGSGNISVIGNDVTTGGTIKTLYVGSLEDANYETGYASFVSSQISNSFFQGSATETLGRAAILEGVESSSIADDYDYDTDHTIYLSLLNGTQQTDLFDVVITRYNQTWAFNYEEEQSAVFEQINNITPVFYNWQNANLTTDQIRVAVTTLINSTVVGS